MYFHELLNKYGVGDIMRELFAGYPDSDIESYSSAIMELRTIKPVINHHKLVVNKYYDNSDPQPDRQFYDVTALLDGESYAITLTSWEEILGMEMGESDYDLSELEILCHILYEITFTGYSDKTVKEQATMIRQRMADYEATKPLENDGD